MVQALSKKGAQKSWDNCPTAPRKRVRSDQFWMMVYIGHGLRVGGKRNYAALDLNGNPIIRDKPKNK